MQIKEMLANSSNDTKGRKQEIKYIVVHHTANRGNFFHTAYEKPFVFLIVVFFLHLLCKLLCQNTPKHQKYSLIQCAHNAAKYYSAFDNQWRKNHHYHMDGVYRQRRKFIRLPIGTFRERWKLYSNL